MSGRSRARRFATGAALYGGGGLGLLTVAVAGLLIGQTRLLRGAIGDLHGGAPACDGLYGAEHPGPPVRFVLLGDSSAAGLGADSAKDTPGALIAAGLAEILGRPVELRCVAVIGSVCADLAPQVDLVLPSHPDLALIMIGGNDVVHRLKPADSVGHLGDAVRVLRESGTEVVVGTCPDLSAIEPLQPPLRWLVRRWVRDMATAQTIATVESGGRTVSLGDLLGRHFASSPKEMFAADKFHPSSLGYASAAAAMLPSVAAALGAWDDRADEPSAARGEGVRSLAAAAAEAATAAGTEVSGTAVAGRRRGPWGRWVELRHRIRLFTRAPAGPARHAAAITPATATATPSASTSTSGAALGSDTTIEERS